MISFTRHLASWLGRRGVRVNCVSPGGLRTPDQPSAFVEAYYERRVPLGRLAGTEDIKGAVAFLASDASAVRHRASTCRSTAAGLRCELRRSGRSRRHVLPGRVLARRRIASATARARRPSAIGTIGSRRVRGRRRRSGRAGGRTRRRPSSAQSLRRGPVGRPPVTVSDPARRSIGERRPGRRRSAPGGHRRAPRSRGERSRSAPSSSSSMASITFGCSSSGRSPRVEADRRAPRDSDRAGAGGSPTRGV